MKKITYFTLVYAIIVLLGGIMSFWHTGHLGSFFFEILGGIVIFGGCYFVEKNKRISYFIIPCIGLILTIYYGYYFSTLKSFYPGIMAAISVFFVGAYIFEIFNIYGRASKP